MEKFNWINYLDAKNVMIDFAASTKDDAITKLVDSLVKSGVVEDGPGFLATVFEREELGSTGIGERVAMPHGKSAGVKKMTVALAKLAAPLDFESVDKNPVDFIFMIASPMNSDSLYIKTMASIIRSVKMNNICLKMQHLVTAGEIYDMLVKECRTV